ncbi:MAG: hypothetical protein NTZ05_09535 [Chloroflexi bacterium]|nr:hypothetical protein [Chloroflexota bacterium]
METVSASLCWDGQGRDIIYLFREPTPALWIADPDDDIAEFSVLRVLDEQEQETGEIAGIEIVDFLKFNQWSDLPDLPLLWQAPDQEPLPYQEVLRRAQASFHAPAPDQARSA